MRRECRERFLRHRGIAIPTCITAPASRTCRDACRDHQLAVSFEVGGGENVPGIHGARATRKFTYLVRGPWAWLHKRHTSSIITGLMPSNKHQHSGNESPMKQISTGNREGFYLSHLPLDKMAAISQTIFSDAFPWMKNFIFRLKFHWSLFLRVQLIITRIWFRKWLGAE